MKHGGQVAGLAVVEQGEQFVGSGCVMQAQSGADGQRP
jgi:hypothetical protein